MAFLGLILNSRTVYYPSDPDGNQAVLAVRQTDPRMSSDFERESSVSPSVNELAARRPAQRDATQNEGPSIKP